MPTATATIDLHLLGPGRVGSAFAYALDRSRFRLRAVTDSSGTVSLDRGTTAAAVLAHKGAGRPLAALPGAAAVDAALAIDLVDADVVIDATATGGGSGADAARRCCVALRRGRALVVAAKDGVAHGAAEWAGDTPRLGINAVLGGTGLALRRERDVLASTRSVTVVANASTTAVIESIEGGASIDGGIANATARGLLEADPTLDLDGSDAAVKLCVVAGLLYGIGLTPTDVEREDLRTLDPELVRGRRRLGWTTRLVARLWPDGRARATYEPVAIGSALDVPADRVAYTYDLGEGRTRVHIGSGLGPERTAAALRADLHALVAEGRLR